MVEPDTHPQFPLPEDEYFHAGAVKPLEPKEMFWLSRAQSCLRVRWRFRLVQPTGRFDAHTAAAVCKVQEKIGHTPNGELDRETWDAIFVGQDVDPPK